MFRKKDILALWLPMLLTVLLTVLQLLPVPTCKQQLSYTSFIYCLESSTCGYCLEAITCGDFKEVLIVWLWEHRSPPAGVKR